MANRVAGKTGTRKLTRLGKGSLGLTLPAGMVKGLGWKAKQNVKVTKKGGALVVRDQKTKKRKR
jgi:antitoxin component of MazEF toxin-antitoxin module